MRTTGLTICCHRNRLSLTRPYPLASAGTNDLTRGISVDYVTRLEQGRAVSPSAQVVEALARALRLSGSDLHIGTQALAG
jgi:transcriptional regulator with XRE-family HTH domain